jgi:hypothetical protein
LQSELQSISQATRLLKERSDSLEANVGDALLYSTYAFSWANEAEDVPLSLGGNTGYSAYHWAQKAATSATSAGTSASNASTSAGNASASASAAQTSETNASNSASAAATSETNAAGSASAAATSETNAAGSASAASNSASDAAGYSNAASNSATEAAGYSGSAYDWANAAEDLPLTIGGLSGYSAYHWAQKALGAANDADTLDGLDSTAFAQKAQDEVITGFWDYQNPIVRVSSSIPRLQLFSSNSANGWEVYGNLNDTANFGLIFRRKFNNATANAVTFGASSIQVGSDFVWHQGNKPEAFARCSLGSTTPATRTLAPGAVMGIELIQKKDPSAIFTQSVATYNTGRALKINRSGWYDISWGFNPFGALTNGILANEFAHIRDVNSQAVDYSGAVVIRAIDDQSFCGQKITIPIATGTELVLKNETSGNLQFWTGFPLGFFTITFLGDL